MTEYDIEKETTIYMMLDHNDIDKLREQLDEATESNIHLEKTESTNSYIQTPDGDYISIPQRAIKHVIATGGAKLMTEIEHVYEENYFTPKLSLNCDNKDDVGNTYLDAFNEIYFRIHTPQHITYHTKPEVFKGTDKEYYLRRVSTFYYKSKEKELNGLHKETIQDILDELRTKYPMFDFLASKVECSTKTIETQECEEKPF